jgi:hypothetical protein
MPTIVADEFTIANIRLTVTGIAAYVKTLLGPALTHFCIIPRDFPGALRICI